MDIHRVDDKNTDVLEFLKYNNLEFYMELSKSLCVKISSRLNELCINEEKREKALFFLNELAKLDVETAEHCMRVALLSEQIAIELGIDRKPLFYSGLLHDVGKVKVAKSDLKKTEGFDIEVVKEHPLNTLRIIGKDFGFSGQIALRHHRYQTKKYPEQLPESEIPFSEEAKTKIEEYSKILAVADCFDASVSRRNDRNNKKDRLTLDEAIENLFRERPEQREIIEILVQTDVFKNHLKLLECNET